MSESKFETVSSLVDNYQRNDDNFDEAIFDLIEDEQLSDTWERYHLLGDVIRGDVETSLPSDFSAQIAQAIADEPTVLAPVSKPGNKSLLKAKVVSLFKPVGQLAIAASAAGLMIFGVQQNAAENNATGVMSNPVVQTTPFGGIADPVSFNFQQPDINAQKRAYIEQQRRFQALLSDHQRQIKLVSAVQTKSLKKNKAEDTPK
ncbi:MAG: transcriptional regulator [Alteromonadaceae bacterium]|nr:transcriptional regulator [Alteromonadaceae bacterium]